MVSQMSPFSVWSLIFGVLSLISLAFGGPASIVGMVLGLVAVALGGIAIRDISLGGSGARGLYLALLGIVLGGILLLANAYRFTATGCRPMKEFKGMYEKAGEVPE